MTKHTCGYRIADGRADPDSPFVGTGRDLDDWYADEACTYCGSLNQDVFMARLEAGDVELVPTDKSYKVYVRNNGGAAFKQTYRDCPPDTRCEGPTECTHWVTRDRQETKFYFYHLNEAQAARFIELYNTKVMKIGYPGHFYTVPFFCRASSQGD